MELHSPTAAKKLWSYLRAVFFMMRKGLVSNKRKFLIDMNLFMKRGNKILGRSLTNLIFHHHHHPHRSQSSATTMMTIMREYEFSCSNSPNPVFSRGRRHAYFPCLNAVVEDEEVEHSWPCAAAAPAAQKRIEYSPQSSSSSSSTATTALLAEELFAPGERCSPSTMSVRIVDYYSDDVDDDDDDEVNGGEGEVDDEAEEFIRRFYEQLRAQRRIAMLEYQEREYQHMLARGT